VDPGVLSPPDCNFLDANRIFMAFSERGEYLERRAVAIACCGLPVQELNWGFLKPPYDDVEGTAAAVRAYFAERNLPFRVSFRGADRARCAPALDAAGWRHGGDPAPGMTLALPATPSPAPAGLGIEEVRTAEQLVGFREAAFRGFGYPVAAARLFLGERLLTLPNVRLYAGRSGDAVVATSMLITTGDVAGIYWVATLEEQRGRGYGAALTWAAAVGGEQRGCRIASLQASKQGRPVYARMGFAHVLDYEHRLPPE
jgi:GNAT superfamily N-acetyltransferase